MQICLISTDAHINFTSLKSPKPLRVTSTESHKMFWCYMCSLRWMRMLMNSFLDILDLFDSINVIEEAWQVQTELKLAWSKLVLNNILDAKHAAKSNFFVQLLFLASVAMRAITSKCLIITDAVFICKIFKTGSNKSGIYTLIRLGCIPIVSEILNIFCHKPLLWFYSNSLWLDMIDDWRFQSF